MKKGVVAVLVTIAVIVAVAITSNWGKIVSWFNPQLSEQVLEVEAPKITTSNVVAQRRMEIEIMKIDSTYYVIPEPALIAILDYIGTDTSRESVVKEYLAGKQYYDGIVKGATKSNHYIPDSISVSNTPIKSAPVIPDTIRH